MASTTAKGKYPEQLIAMVTPETKAFIRDEARDTGRSISEVARDYVEAGIDRKTSMLTVQGDGTLIDGDGIAVEVIQSEHGEFVVPADNDAPPRPLKSFY
jgi:hypothetical protein